MVSAAITSALEALLRSALQSENLLSHTTGAVLRCPPNATRHTRNAAGADARRVRPHSLRTWLETRREHFAVLRDNDAMSIRTCAPLLS